MSALTRLLLISAALLLWSAIAHAKEIKGAPKELIGYYGANADACRSYNRSGGDKLITIRQAAFSECMGKWCKADILSHRKTSGGYILNLRFRYDRGPTDEERLVRLIGKNAIKLDSSILGNEVMTRCTVKDIIAGIGQPAADETTDVDFGFFYARTAIKLCPSLRPGPEFQDREVSPYGRQMPDVMGRAAHYAKLDKREVKTFCKNVLDAFGKNGRVNPGLVSDASHQN